MRHNLSDILNLIRDRRSVSPDAFKKRAVQRDQLNAMLEAANWAPTHGLTEPWRFKVFGGAPLRQLMEKLASIYKSETPEASFNPLKYQKFFDRADKVSAVITVHMKRHADKKVTEEDEVMAVACAVQNMALVAAAYGMTLFWSTPGMMHHKDFQEFLDIQAPDRCLGILYIGYPDLPEWPKGRRNIWMNKVEWLTD